MVFRVVWRAVGGAGGPLHSTASAGIKWRGVQSNKRCRTTGLMAARVSVVTPIHTDFKNHVFRRLRERKSLQETH